MCGGVEGAGKERGEVLREREFIVHRKETGSARTFFELNERSSDF